MLTKYIQIGPVLTVYRFRTEASLGFWAPTFHFLSYCFSLGLKLCHWNFPSNWPCDLKFCI